LPPWACRRLRSSNDDGPMASCRCRHCRAPTQMLLPPRPRRKGLDGILRNPNAFLLNDCLSSELCENIIRVCECEFGFGRYNAGKNNHGAMQIVASRTMCDVLYGIIGPNVDVAGISDMECKLRGGKNDGKVDGGGGRSLLSSSLSSRRHYTSRGINRHGFAYTDTHRGGRRNSTRLVFILCGTKR
jgi:hypothetical protein